MSDGITLNYVERRGQHTRVGLLAPDGEPFRDETDADRDRMERAVEDLAGVYGDPWDVSISHDGERVELSYET